MIPVDALTMFLNTSGMQVSVVIICFVLLITPMIASVLYLHAALRIARAQTAQYRTDYNRLLGRYTERTRELKISETAYEHLDNRYTTMEATFLHNERQLKELVDELSTRIEYLRSGIKSVIDAGLSDIADGGDDTFTHHDATPPCSTCQLPDQELPTK